MNTRETNFTLRSCASLAQQASPGKAGFTEKRPVRKYRAFFMGRGGFEPPKSATADLQSAPFGHSGTYPYKRISQSFKTKTVCRRRFKVPPGFGPGNEGFADLCLTTWLWHQIKWSGRRDSDSRPPPWQGGALPTELLPQMVPWGGIEPPTL